MTVLLTREVPLPDMPAVEPLWAVCIHTRKAVDIRAMPDRETADKEAFGINDWLDAIRKHPDVDDNWPITVSAEVIEWPYSPDTHAESLAEQRRRDEEMP